MKNQKGGYFKKISFDEWENFQSPHKIKNDCCPCCFRLLNMIDDEEFTKLLDIFPKKGGMSLKDLERFFEDKYPDYKFEFFDFDFNMEGIFREFQVEYKEQLDMIKKDKNSPEMVKLNKRLKKILDKRYKKNVDRLTKNMESMVNLIENEYAVLGGARSQTGGKHCIVFFRDTKKPGEKRGKLYILDPQASEMHTAENDLDLMEDYIAEHKITNFYIMFSNHKEDDLPLFIGENEKRLDPLSDDPSSDDFYSLSTNTLTSDYKEALGSN